VKRLRIAIAVAVPFVGLPVAALEPPGPSTAGEYEVKAAYLYHFAKFVAWPPEARGDAASFVIAVLGEDPFETALDDALRGKTVEGRKVVVRRASRVEDAVGSQILFISGSEQGRLGTILKALEAAPGTLTVGDMDGFAAHGGVIAFRLEGNRVRLDVSLAAAERARLKISSQLLRLARIVDARVGN
jgi:YfiR/HmsC-like